MALAWSDHFLKLEGYRCRRCEDCASRCTSIGIEHGGRYGVEAEPVGTQSVNSGGRCRSLTSFFGPLL